MMEMTAEQIIEADLTWTGERFESGIRIAVNAEGVIASVGELNEKPTHRLKDSAILPGFVNAHSHAFQRGLRGRGETFPRESGSFWTWRDAMYKLVDLIDEESIYRLSRQAFSEMLAAGMTTVGEFHYLHHTKHGKNYACDEIVLKAARDAGIRIVLVNAFYKTGGIGQSLAGAQKRFESESMETFWNQMDSLESELDSQTQSIGVAAHSIRAVTIDEIVALHEEALKRHFVFHMHVEEQPLEIEECIRAHRKSPLALLNERLQINPKFTAIHCTHTAAADFDEYLHSGGNVCLCPLTEANLGDGVPNVSRILKAHGRISIGTDSNARISMTEELRLLEYVQRLILQERGVCVDDSGHVACKLLEMATVNGALSLGVKTGKIERGYLADFQVIDLHTPSLCEWNNDTLLTSFILGSGNDAISSVCVGGQWIE